MNDLHRACLILLFLLLPISALTAQELPEKYAQAIAEVEKYIQQELDNEAYVGLSIGFSYGDVEWAKGYGYADLENRVPATAASSYRMASVSKPMTAVGILKLMEQGKLDLDAEVQTYVPDFPRKKWPVTVRQLLGHLGGISHYRNYSQEAGITTQLTTAEALAIFQDWELLQEPGTRYSYTTYGYNVLWAILEGASGMSFSDYMKQDVWGPLKMENASVDYLFKLVPNRVRGYRMVNGNIENTLPVNTSLKIGGGGTRANTYDMLRFARGLGEGKVLSAETLEMMWTSMATSDQRETGYGMGWGIGDLNGRYMVNHSGAQEGTRTQLIYLPAEKIALFGASNLEGASPRRVLVRLLNGILGDPPSSAEPYFPSAKDYYMHRGLQAAFANGLAYYDWQNRPYSDDPAQVAAAFKYINDFSKADESAIDRERFNRLLDDGHHPLTQKAFLTAGAFMAAEIEKSAGQEQLARLNGQGALAFAGTYLDVCKKNAKISSHHRFTNDFARAIHHWQKDWQAANSDGIANLEINSASNLKSLKQQLKTAFADKRIYADFSDRISSVARELFMKGQEQKALSFAEFANELYPASAIASGNLGMMYVMKGKAGKGKALLKASMEIDENGIANQGNLNSTAYALKGAGKLEAGMKLLQAAIDLNPQVANLYDSYGEFHLEKGEIAAAIRYYKKALEIDPDFGNAKFMLEQIKKRQQGELTQGNK